MHEALCWNMKIWPVKGRGLGHVTIFEIFGLPLYLWNSQR